MVKKITIFLLFTYLLSVTPLGQIFKLPILLEHYKEHHTENKNLSFLGYLKMHYFNGNPKDADSNTDMKLPFKTTHFNTNIVTCILFDDSCFKIEKSRFCELTVQTKFKLTCWFSDSYLTAIWQPPRVA